LGHGGGASGARGERTNGTQLRIQSSSIGDGEPSLSKVTSIITLMAIEDALNRLGSEANAELAWAFGDVSRVWAS
jgi:hypothetical protein